MNTSANQILKLILSLVLAGSFLSACGKNDPEKPGTDEPEQNETKVCDPADYCKNGGTCSVNDQGAKQCDCTGTNFTGDTCTEPKEMAETCDDTYCKNGGTCSIVDGKRSCDCSSSNYKGETCETSKTCEDDNPCKNDGQCSVDGTTGALTCDCSKTDFAGETCAEPKTCENANPCKNGGECRMISTTKAFVCDCTKDYGGVFCEDEARAFKFKIKIEHGGGYWINTNPDYGYDYELICDTENSGDVKNSFTGNAKCEYENDGEYVLSIKGKFPQLYNHVNSQNSWPGYLINRHIKEVIDWGNGAWKSLEGMFKMNDKLTGLSESTPNFSRLTSMKDMFAHSSFNGSIPKTWDTSSVTNMKGMFFKAKTFNGDLSGLNTSNVTNMSDMFYQAKEFDNDISQWDTSHVTDMSHMFSLAEKFNKPLKTDGNQWNTSKVTDMSNMFNGASAFEQDISNWEMKNVQNCKGFSSQTSASWKSDQKPELSNCGGE